MAGGPRCGPRADQRGQGVAGLCAEPFAVIPRPATPWERYGFERAHAEVVGSPGAFYRYSQRSDLYIKPGKSQLIGRTLKAPSFAYDAARLPSASIKS